MVAKVILKIELELAVPDDYIDEDIIDVVDKLRYNFKSDEKMFFVEQCDIFEISVEGTFKHGT